MKNPIGKKPSNPDVPKPPPAQKPKNVNDSKLGEKLKELIDIVKDEVMR